MSAMLDPSKDRADLKPIARGSAGDGEVPPPPRSWTSWGVPLMVVAVVVGLGLLLWYVMSQPSAPQRRQTVKIAVLPDTPPPPPPPKEEKKIEPEKKELAPQPQQAQPKPQEAPPEPQQLKMEGTAGDGPSPFSAGQVATEYKGGEIGTGTGGNKLQFALFTSRLTRHIQGELSRDQALKGQDYRVNVRLWLGPAGELQRIELASSTGQDELDKTLRQSLARIPGIDQVPPNLPQPLLLRITNRVTG